MDFDEYRQYDGLGLAELVKTKQVTSRELVDVALQAIEHENPAYNAVIELWHDRAQKYSAKQEFHGPFAGVPFLLKDLFAQVAHVPTRSGSYFCNQYVLHHDSELVKRYRKSGVVFLGKTNTPEFGMSPVTEPVAFGATKNPIDTNYTCGGSSGGAAVAVARGWVPVAHASDGGGSIRIPASCCGVFGLKPSRGRMPSGPDTGRKWQGCALDHVITRSVRDSAAMLDATAGSDVGAPFYTPDNGVSFLEQSQQQPQRLKVAVCTEAFFSDSPVHEDNIAAVQDAASLCQTIGHHVEYAIPQINGEQLKKAYNLMVACELNATLQAVIDLLGRKPRYAEIEASNWMMIRYGQAVSGAEYARAMQLIDTAGRQMARFMQQYDVLLTPTLAKPPVKIGELQPNWLEYISLLAASRVPISPIVRAMVEFMVERVFAFMPFTPLFNLTGQPAMSVPAL